MNTRAPREVVEAFMDALAQRDFERAGTFLSRPGFSYRGPTDDFDDADTFIADISRIGPILERIERRRTFVDGEDVCVIYTFYASMPELNKTRVAQWFKVDNGLITGIEVFFDARAYLAMFER